MAKLKVQCFGMSLDGFGAGPDQDIDNPLGVDGLKLLQWYLPTRAFRKMHGREDGTTGIDNDFADRDLDQVGAWIIGRNMFSPMRGPWPDESWKGWWGENPPYHTDVFVLTNHLRPSIPMEGGTTFHFVKDGIETALRLAKESAKGLDVRIGGGLATVRQYLQAGLIDELHIAVSPVLLGRGESLFAGIDLVKLGYKCTENVSSAAAMHVVLSK